MNTRKNNTAVVFIAGSAGELDWILPIVDFLVRKKFNIHVIFLSRHAEKSVNENYLCREFILTNPRQIAVTSLGGSAFEALERLSYLSYRVFLKVKLFRLPPINFISDSCFTALRLLFISRLPVELTTAKRDRFLFFTEFPGLRRPRDKWVRQVFKASTFFYCPHSPHVYVEDLDRIYNESRTSIDKTNSFLVLGHPGDFEVINDGKELASADLGKLYMGHPKYSEAWLENFREKSYLFRTSRKTREKVDILVLSRGAGSYLDEAAHAQMVEKTIEVITTEFPDYRIFVKKHPRESQSSWDLAATENKAIQIVSQHILQAATSVDFVISFWGSGCMDCFFLGVPVIEYWDPEKHRKQQVPVGDTFTTIYRKLGVVLEANSASQLGEQIQKLKARNFSMEDRKIHPHLQDIISRSNQWTVLFEQVLKEKDFLVD